MSEVLGQAAGVSTAKCHRPGDLSQWRFIFHGSGGCKSDMKVPGWLCSGDRLFQVSGGRLLTVSSCGEKRQGSSLVSSYKSTDPIKRGATLMT